MKESGLADANCVYAQTTLLNVLAQRVSSGVVTGGRYVNGQGLPPDFQAQTYVSSLILSVL